MKFLQMLFGKRQHYQVYCQGCNSDITAHGGYVSVSGGVYCGELKQSGIRCVATCFSTPADAEELQIAIRKGRLKKYSSLEEQTKAPTGKFSSVKIGR